MTRRSVRIVKPQPTEKPAPPPPITLDEVRAMYEREVAALVKEYGDTKAEIQNSVASEVRDRLANAIEATLHHYGLHESFGHWEFTYNSELRRFIDNEARAKTWTALNAVLDKAIDPDEPIDIPEAQIKAIRKAYRDSFISAVKEQAIERARNDAAGMLDEVLAIPEEELTRGGAITFEEDTDE